MFDGDPNFIGSEFTYFLLFVIDFFTLIFYFAQEDDIIVPLLDVCQTLIAWPSFSEGFILTIFVWSLRHIERIIGKYNFAIFLIYNLLTYLPFFVFMIEMKGFRIHFSLFYFLPFSMFIFALWQTPSSNLFSFITDKIILCLAIITITIIHFPYPLFILPTSILGNILWSFDIFRLKKCIAIDLPQPQATSIDDIAIDTDSLNLSN